MTKITYGDKTAVKPQVSHATQWWADDATEVKTVVNGNDTVDISTSATIVFDEVTGYRHGTWGTPITGTITLDDATAVEGACAVMIWSGSSTPTFSGGDIQSMSGAILESGTYSIYFHYLNERININVFNVSGSVDVTAPVMLSATIEDADPTDIVMVFSEAVTGTNLGFTIAGTTSTSFSSISGSGTTTITGVLGTAAAYGETITLDYSSSTGDIEDSSGNVLVTFTGASVVNNISGVVEIYPQNNAASIDTEVDSVGTWVAGPGTSTIISQATEKYDGSWALEQELTATENNPYKTIPIPCEESTAYTVTMRVKKQAGATGKIEFRSTQLESGYVNWNSITETWDEYTQTITTQAGITSFDIRFYGAVVGTIGDKMWLDAITITKN